MLGLCASILQIRVQLFCALLVVLVLFPVYSGLAIEPPDQAQLLFDQARFDLMNGDHDQALVKLRQAQKLNPGNPQYAMWEVRLLGALGQSDQALGLCERLIKQDPRAYAPLRFHAANILWGRQQHQRAISHLRQAERHQPARSVRTQMNLLMEEGDYEACALTGQRLKQASPETRQEIMLLAARARYNNYQYDQALDQLSAARKLVPKSELVKEIDALEKQVRLTDRPWWLGGNVAVKYDSNVFLDPVVDDPAHAVASGRDDFASMYEVWGGVRLGRWQGWTLALTAHVQRMDYFTESEASYMFWAPGVYLSWGKAKWGFSLAYNFYYYYHEGRMDDWSRIHSLTPSVYWQMTQHLKTYFSMVGLERQYFDGRSGALHFGGIVDHVYTFDQRSDFVRLSYRYDVEDAYDNISGYKGIEVTVALGRRIYGNLSGEVGATYAHYDYDKRQEWTLNYQVFERQDDQLRFFMSLYYRLPNWWQIGLNWYSLNNDSNVETGTSPYDYNKYVIMLNFSKSF